ncbi:MAG: sensor histidine kinase [Spirosomataceae bacterium]
MSLRTKFIVFVVLLHAITIGLSFYVFKSEKILFIFSEIFILISLFISWQLYQQLIQPISFLMSGANAIKDRDFNVKFLKTGRYEMDELIEVYNQMIDEIRHERTQQEEQHYFLEKLVKTSPTGIIIFDYDGKIMAINPRAESIISRVPILETIKSIPEKQVDGETFYHNGETYKIQKAQFIDRGFPRFFVMIEELTTQILAAEKKAYGKVIRMMAHEVNNSIGAVNSIIDTTLQLQNEDSEIREALQIAIERNNNLNYFMRNFADVVRLPEPRLERTDLIVTIRKVIKLIEFRLLNKKINLHFEEYPETFFINIDVQQFEQVLINIIKNAIESIENEGEILIKLSKKNKSLQIIDNGKGVPQGIESQLFTPFFTTKKDGQGIGLTLIREILVNHGFEFSLKTFSENKTIFEIKFE